MKFILATLSCSLLVLSCGDVNTNETPTDAGVLASCGNGMVESGEECDDGNEIDTDVCLNSCVRAACGDMVIGPGELCDDGNSDNEVCTENCTLASCGNGVQEGLEECDDGNGLNTDGCLSTCKTAICGDTFVFTGEEECDDGNDENTDSCVSCSDAICGDGFVEAGSTEECDDSNLDEADSCSGQCVEIFFSGSQATCSAEGTTLCGYFNAECRVDSAGVGGGELCYWPMLARCTTAPGILVEVNSSFAQDNSHLTIPSGGACLTHFQNLECSVTDRNTCANAAAAGCFQEKQINGGDTKESSICFWNVTEQGCSATQGIWTEPKSPFAVIHPTVMPGPGAAACITQVANIQI